MGGGLLVVSSDVASSSNSQSEAATGERRKYVNMNDPVEMEFASRLQMPDLAHVAGSTSHAYVCPWNAFVLWCGSLMRHRRSLPGIDLMVALYFQSLMDKANSFSTIKSASVSIAFFYMINLFTNPTMAPEVCVVRIAAARKFDFSTKRVKESFLWFQLVDFALLYGIQNQGHYCHLVIATMDILSFWRYVPL